MSRRSIAAAVLLMLLTTLASAQTRDEKVRLDRRRVEADESWIYTNLPLAKQLAKTEGKPLLVIFRCIPCEACALLDEQVVARDEAVRSIMDKFICVRIPKANAMDLTQFQFDYDLSFQAFFMNADGTIYGRYGTRSSREHADSDVSLEGFAAAMEGALLLHAGYPVNRGILAGKQAKPVEFKRPEEYPSLKGKYQEELDFTGQTAKSCLHCHQIRDAQRDLARSQGIQWNGQLMYPYPTPDAVGWKLNPQTRATLEAVEPASPAASAGFQQGDEIIKLGGQAIVSAADLQWVLHHAESPAQLPALIRRGENLENLILQLPDDWRQRSDISWRVSTWNLRRMAFGGMFLVPLTEQERSEMNLSDDQLALRAQHVGQYGDHARAKQAGLRKDDVILSFNGIVRPLNETNLLAAVLNSTRPGSSVPVSYLRDGKRHETNIRLP